MSAQIEFKKVKCQFLKTFHYESRGDFRMRAYFLKIVKNSDNKTWSIIAFYDGKLKGEIFINNCRSKADAVDTVQDYF
jgi:hypothetical protein